METPSWAHLYQYSYAVEARCHQHLRQELGAFHDIDPKLSVLLNSYPLGGAVAVASCMPRLLQSVPNCHQSYAWRSALTCRDTATETIPVAQQACMRMEPQIWQSL